MKFSVLILFLCLNFSIAVLHIDKVVHINNKLYNNINSSYYHDEKENVHVDYAIQTKAVASKMLVYVKVNLAENKDDRKFSREFLRTVIDFDKLIKGLYGNPLISNFMKNFMTQVDSLNLKSPLPIVGMKDIFCIKYIICSLTGSLRTQKRVF